MMQECLKKVFWPVFGFPSAQQISSKVYFISEPINILLKNNRVLSLPKGHCLFLKGQEVIILHEKLSTNL